MSCRLIHLLIVISKVFIQQRKTIPTMYLHVIINCDINMYYNIINTVLMFYGTQFIIDIL